MNKIILTGNLGHGATVRDVTKPDNSGTTPVVNFSLAVKIGYGVQAQTAWYGCSWWGERAEKVSQWLTRGRRVLVEGEPGLRMWTKRDGSGTGAEIAVRVTNVELLGDARSDEGASGIGSDSSVEVESLKAEAEIAKQAAEDVPY